jgi:hypothetical protein
VVAIAAAVLSATALAGCTRSTAGPSVPEAGDPSSTGATPAVPNPSGSASGSTGASSIGPEDAVRTVVLGDEATRPAEAADPAWPDLLAATLEEAGIPISVETTAEPSAGFASSPGFADLVAQRAEGATQLVVLFDGRLADATAADLGAAALDAGDAVERASPDAELVVVGPLPSGDEARDRARAAALREATEEAGGLFVDPLAEGWPPDATPRQVADFLQIHLQPITQSLAASGANR